MILKQRPLFFFFFTTFLMPLSLWASAEVTLSPGKARLIKFQIPADLNNPSLECGGKRALYFKKDNEYRAYISESYFSKRKLFDCELKGSKKEKILTVKIEEFAYPQEVLQVDSKRVSLSAKDLAKAKQDTEVLEKVFSAPGPLPFFQEAFIAPLDSFITSHFGTQRVFNNTRKGQHLGTDFRAAVGVPVKNSNHGKVVFKGNLFFGGNTLIIDHGAGIFSLYSHLSKFKVKVGQEVKKGDIVALSGSTGRVSGPHLHWGVKIMGNSVDPFSLVDASKE